MGGLAGAERNPLLFGSGEPNLKREQTRSETIPHKLYGATMFGYQCVACACASIAALRNGNSTLARILVSL